MLNPFRTESARQEPSGGGEEMSPLWYPGSGRRLLTGWRVTDGAKVLGVIENETLRTHLAH